MPVPWSKIGVPITARDGRSHGGLFLVHDKAGAFDERDERLVVGIAGQAAVALDDARLYEDERDARQRLAVLAEVGRVLGSSFDVDELLQRVAAVLVPWLVDGCVIDVTEVGGVHHSASVGRRPVTDDVTTVVEVPLEARDGVIGSLSLAIGPERRPPNGEDMTVLADLGRRIAVAVENARLFAHQRSVAITLQRSLLPDRLPAVPGVSMAARYLPGGIDVEIDVGGDWYDVLPFPDGTLGMAMGDVVGRGVRAAALMGQLRSALRAYAFEGHTPGACLTRLNALLEAITGGTLVTAVKGHLEPRTGRLLLANAGHPPPLVVHADGSTEFVAASLGVPLSTLADPDYVDVTIQLEPGALVAFYTDGLVEERDESLDEGFGRLVDAFGSGPVDDLEALCEHVLAKMGSDRAARDDTALLVVRLSSVR